MNLIASGLFVLNQSRRQFMRGVRNRLQKEENAATILFNSISRIVAVLCSNADLFFG